MENRDEKMYSVLMKIVEWNVYHMLDLKHDEETEKMFEDTSSFNEIALDNLNYHYLKLDADKHLVIGFNLIFDPIFLRNYFHLYGFINKKPYIKGEVVFDNSNLFHVLGFELEIKDDPNGHFIYCRYCPSDVHSSIPGSELDKYIKMKRKFEKEFNDFYYSSLVNI